MNTENPGTVGTVTALRLDDVKLWPDGSGPELSAEYLLVPVDDIKLIGVEVKPTASSKAGNTAAP